MTDPEQVKGLVERTIEVHGRVDVLLNNAGQGLHVPVEDIEPADLRAVFELNVIAPLVGLQAVLPHMRARSCGAVVNVSSATSLRVFAGLGGYSATKAALNQLSQVARLELAASGVTVSVVYPSITATEFHDRLRAGAIAAGASNIARDRPELVAEAVVYAISTGEAHVLVADPPRAIVPGGDDAWSALLARQSLPARQPGTGR